MPPDGNRLADYIYSRLLNSMLNFSAGRFLTWQAFWNSDSTCVGWSVHDEFNHLKDRIDHNQLTPLGLVAKSGGPGASHQVLAYGYDYDANGHPMVYIWDNNRPDVECVLKANQQLDAICEYNTATDPGDGRPFEQWKGFFVHDDYNLSAPQHPPYQDIAMSQAVVLAGAHVRPDPSFNPANPVSPTCCRTTVSRWPCTSRSRTRATSRRTCTRSTPPYEDRTARTSTRRWAAWTTTAPISRRVRSGSSTATTTRSGSAPAVQRQRRVPLGERLLVHRADRAAGCRWPTRCTSSSTP